MWTLVMVTVLLAGEAETMKYMRLMEYSTQEACQKDATAANVAVNVHNKERDVALTAVCVKTLMRRSK